MELLSQMWEAIAPHWPFAAATLILAFVGQVVKGTVWTEANFLKWRMEKPNPVLWRFFWWGRKTMPLHPVAVGALLGLVPNIPAGTGIEGRPATMLYFAFAGVMSTWAFALVKAWAKKHDIDLKLPGQPSTPPPAQDE
jgi:hypothetical protein